MKIGPRLCRWVVEAGGFEISVGSSSRDLPGAATISVKAFSIAAPLGPDSTSQEWLADPKGRQLIREGSMPLMGNEEQLEVIGSIPISTLAAL